MRRAAAMLAVAAMLCLAACGHSGASKQASAGTSPGRTGVAACRKATGPRVKILTMLDESQAANVYLPNLRAGINAGVHRINCEGGLGDVGSPVQVDFCVTSMNPNQVQACAGSAINNKSYVAAVGDEVQESDPGSEFAAAGLPDIPADALTLSELTGATTFNTNAAVIHAAGEATLACHLRYKKTNQLFLDVPDTAVVIRLENQALRSYGCAPIAKTVKVPLTATDLSAEVYAASAGADAVILNLSPHDVVQAFAARQQLGIQTPFMAEGAVMSADTLKAVGDKANGMLVADWYPPGNVSSAGNREFLADMSAVGQSGEADDMARAGWVATDLLATAAHGLRTVSRASVLKALRSMTSFDAAGMTPPLDFTKPAPDPQYPRVFNLTISPSIVAGGQFKAVSGLPTFIPIFKGIG